MGTPWRYAAVAIIVIANMSGLSRGLSANCPLSAVVDSFVITRMCRSGRCRVQPSPRRCIASWPRLRDPYQRAIPRHTVHLLSAKAIIFGLSPLTGVPSPIVTPLSGREFVRKLQKMEDSLGLNKRTLELLSKDRGGGAGGVRANKRLLAALGGDIFNSINYIPDLSIL